MMPTFDHSLFLSLNFDGGPAMDRLMLLLSGKATWVPLYLLILWLLYRRDGWRGVALFLGLAAMAVVLTDMAAGIFKHTGLLKNCLPDFQPRLRPMYTPELGGLVHVVKLGGRYGTVSAHAATTCSVALLASLILKDGRFSALMVLWTLAVCYSRIYLAYHFPLDILYGLVLGALIALGALPVYRRFAAAPTAPSTSSPSEMKKSGNRN